MNITLLKNKISLNGSVRLSWIGMGISQWLVSLKKRKIYDRHTGGNV